MSAPQQYRNASQESDTGMAPDGWRLAIPPRTVAALVAVLVVVTLSIVLSDAILEPPATDLVRDIAHIAALVATAAIVLSHLAYGRKGVVRLRLDVHTARRDVVNARDRVLTAVAARGSAQELQLGRQQQLLEEALVRLREISASLSDLRRADDEKPVKAEDIELIQAYLFDLLMPAEVHGKPQHRSANTRKVEP